MSVSIQIRQEITQKIVESLEKGVLPWRRPWRVSPNAGRPANVVSHQPYRGINILLCQLHALRYGFSTRWFGTFEQIKNLGGMVKKRPADVPPGEWGCKVVFFKPLTKTITDEDTGEDREQTIPLLRTYTVFSIDQCEGAALDKFRVIESPDDAQVLPDFAPVDDLIAKAGVPVVYGGEQAYYRRPMPEGSWPHHTEGDTIAIPHRHRFLNVAAFYESLLHEECHATEVRLGWDHRQHGYAAGELRAELGACFVAAELGIPPGETDDNHAAYMANWLQGMKADPSFIFRISSDASKAADYLVGLLHEEAIPTGQPA